MSESDDASSDDELMPKVVHHGAIGYVASEWAWFEFWIDNKTLELAKIPFETGICITSQIAGSARKIDAYIALARHCGAISKTLSLLEQFAKDTAGLAEQRNRIIHDPWVIDDNPEFYARLEVTARRKLKFQLVPSSTDKIAELGLKIIRHRERFDSLHQKVSHDLNT